MGRPKNITTDELTMKTRFRIRIVKWKEHNPDIGKMKGRLDFLKLKAARTTDTINEEPLDVRGLFFDMLRHSAGGRRAGYLVDGANEPLTLTRLCKIMNVKLESIIPPLKRLMETDRIQLQIDSQDYSAEETETEEAEDPKENPAEKIRKYQAARMFWMAWQELHFKSYEREYDKSQWDDNNILKALTPESLERFIAYAFYFHQYDNEIGIATPENNKLKPPCIDNYLKKVSSYSSTLRGDKWQKCLKFSQKFLQTNQSLK